MYCTQCGAQIAVDSQFCDQCGAVVPQIIEPAAVTSRLNGPSPIPAAAGQTMAVTMKTSGMAVTTLVFSIISIFINFISVYAIIFGGLAIVQTTRNPALKGKSLAIVGLVLGLFMLISWIAVSIWDGFTISWIFTVID
jgi:hypothetical protein